MKEPIKEFTTSVPFWQPRVIPLELEDASDEQLNAMKVTVSNTCLLYTSDAADE